MLSDPTQLEEEKLLGFQLMVFQETLDATAAPSRLQQLSSSIITWHGMYLALSEPWVTHSWAALVKNIHALCFLIYNLVLAGIWQKNPVGYWSKF